MEKLNYIMLVICSLIRKMFMGAIYGRGIHINWFTLIHPSATIRLFGKNSKVVIGNRVYIRNNSEIEACNGTIVFEDNVFINKNCMIVSMKKIFIGSNTTIAPGVMIYDHDHNFYNITKEKYICKAIEIGKNVWIGANCVILKGVTIGDNAIIGAGSVVTRDVEKNCLYVGNPAIKVKTIKV
ncbi:DapH/DapD/GlmU-related protein [Cohnella sp.]|uniref:acyltransferase n=1 Tax=Cohnella sp. TaxID=1883426 RepID=UPI0035655761